VSQSTPDDPAHILFTSGSTGTPKGVVITHANVVHFIDWAVRYFAMGPDDRVSAHPPLHFDLSFFDLFGAFAAGASVHLVPAALSVLPGRLADFIRERELTQWFSVPSVLAYLAQLDAVRHGDFPSLKRVLWCGDVLATPVLQHWMARVPHATYTNLYGPTETTIASSYYRVPARPEDPRADVPIGVACDGEELLVLDEALQPVAPGAVGILYISGVGLAPGYWGDGRETEAAFRPHPTRAGQRLYRTGDLARIDERGLAHFLGRGDSQVKSRGYRIELGEIEAALNTAPGVHESAVVAVGTDGFEGAEICGAYVPHAGSGVTPASLRRHLQRMVPAYMVPSRWLAVDGLPRTGNGKTDRRELRKMFERGSSVAAHTA
jgi:amino acid adenylation domain-containing protein